MTQETPNLLQEGLSGPEVMLVAANLRAILQDLNPEKAMADARETAAILERAKAAAKRIDAAAERAAANAELSAAAAELSAANAERAADANERSTDTLVARLEAMGYGDGGNGTCPPGYGDSRDQGE